jgi:hypothetical protein
MVLPVVISALRAALEQHQAVFPLQESPAFEYASSRSHTADPSSIKDDVILVEPMVPTLDDCGTTRRYEIMACLSSNTPVVSNFTLDEKVFIIDTGASITITSDASDFPQGFWTVQLIKLQGVTSGLAVQGVGTAAYHFKMDDGSIVSVDLHNVLYVPGCPVHLLCPRHVAKNTKGMDNGFNSQRDYGVFTLYGKT